MNKTLRNIAVTLAMLMGLALPVAAQTTVTQTTTTAAIGGSPTGGTANMLVQVTSATNIVVGTEIFIDREAMLVTAQGATTTNLTVQRGYDGTQMAAHASGAIVYAGPVSSAGPGSPFVMNDPPFGGCTLTAEQYSLRVSLGSGDIWACTGGQWMNVIDSFAWIGAGNCWYGVTTGTLTTPTFGAAPGVTALGLNVTTSVGPAVPVMQVATTNAAVISTNTITCNVPVPSRVSAGRGVYVVDATFMYGLQQAGGVNATQVAVEASGTMNGVLVFSQVTYPAAGAAETPSTVAPVRWDAGTLVLNPAKAAFNSLVTTAGSFFSQKFTPATPMAMVSDFVQYFVSLPILCNTTQATTINSPGVLIHYRTVTGL